MQVQIRAAALTLAAFALPAPALAANPVTVGDRYEQTMDYTQCNNSVLCRLDFAPVPAGKVLQVDQVACFIEGTQPLRIIYLGVSDTPGNSMKRYTFVPFSTAPAQAGGMLYYTTSAQVSFMVGPGRLPVIAFGGTGGSFGAGYMCQIAGRLIQ